MTKELTGSVAIVTVIILLFLPRRRLFFVLKIGLLASFVGC